MKMDLIKEALDEIEALINEVPADEEGHYTNGAVTYVKGLRQARMILKEKVKKRGNLQNDPDEVLGRRKSSR